MAIKLTDKERQILALTDGRSMTQIGKLVGLSTSGVKFHSDSLRKKLGVQQRWELIALRDEVLNGTEASDQ